MYSSFDDVVDARLIIDCGAYTGLSSIWFLNRHPNAHVISVEPDPANFRLCKRNLSPYRGRVTLIPAAIWPYQTKLVISRGQFRDGGPWTTQVRECLGDEKPDVWSVDINTLIKQSGFAVVDILKVDIEKSELALFSHDYKKWLNRIRNIVIELHDKECEGVFFKALSGYNYELLRSGELTICRNLRPRGEGIL